MAFVFDLMPPAINWQPFKFALIHIFRFAIILVMLLAKCICEGIANLLNILPITLDWSEKLKDVKTFMGNADSFLIMREVFIDYYEGIEICYNCPAFTSIPTHYAFFNLQNNWKNALFIFFTNQRLNGSQGVSH